MGRGALAALLLAAAAAAASAGEALELETLEGHRVALALRDGEKALVVHFWATWCPECVDELPILAEARRGCRGSGVRVEVVDVAESQETIAAYLARHGLDLEPLRDPRGRVWREVGGVGLPTNLTWTRAGRRVEVGPRDGGGWRRALRELGCEVEAGSRR